MTDVVRVAVVGKGGSGKSTIAGTLSRLLARQGRKVLALDSDPMPGLALSLGLGNYTEQMLTGAVEKDLNGRWQLRKGIGGARAVGQFAIEGPDGVRFLQFGKADELGLGTMFASVSGFGQVVHRIADDGVLSEWSIVGDLSAGTRQTAYDWAPYADTYLVVVEPTWKSILTGRRIVRLAEQRGADRIHLVASKVAGPEDVALIEQRMEKTAFAAVVLDPVIAAADSEGAALIDHAPDSAAVRDIEELAEGLGSDPAFDGKLGS
jgi:CO dehydrogenase maturation factor